MDKILKKIMISTLIALLAGLIGVCAYNADLLLHKGSEGRFDIMAGSALSEDGSSLDISLGEGTYIRKLELSYEKDGTDVPSFSVVLNGEKGETLIEDRNPYNLTAEVINIREVVEHISIRADGCMLTGARIQNDLSFPPALFVFASLSALALSLIWAFGPALRHRPELVLVITALCLGISMCVALPRDKVGYDEEEHLKAVIDMAAFPGRGVPLSDAIYDQLSVNMYSSSDLLPDSLEETEELDDYLAANGDYEDGEHVFDHDMLKNRAPAYGAMALAMKLGMLMGLSWPLVLLMTRLANLLMYTLLMYLAIRRAPVGRWLLLLIGLFPQNIFMAATLSYDPFITGCLLLGAAAMLSFFDAVRREDRGAALRDFALMSGAYALGCLPKAVYAPMVLMPFAVLLKPGMERKDRRRLTGFLIVSLIIFAGLIGSFILPTVMAPAETGDLRGGATSEVSQVGYILQDPLGYAMLLIRMIISWIPQCFIGPDCTTFMGALVNGSTAFQGYYVPYFLLILWLCVTEPLLDEREAIPGALQKLWIFLMTGACSVLIWTSMYVAFTVPGSDIIAGVQGRYFIPLMYPLYLLFYLPKERAGAIRLWLGGKLESHMSLWYYLMMTIPAALLCVTVWSTVISRFAI